MTSYADVWRAFEANEISHSAAHYLLAIAGRIRQGAPPRAVEIAEQLGVSRAAVSQQVRHLREQALVELDADQRIVLTEAGAELVARIAGKREVMRIFLSEVLGVDPALAEEDACKVEHLISEETGAGLVRLVSFLRSEHPAAVAAMEAFSSLTAHCPPTSRCDLCSEICLLSLIRRGTAAPAGSAQPS